MDEARLWGADLERAKLVRADLFGANLSGTNLQHADLRATRLTGAKNLTTNQLLKSLSLYKAELDDLIKAQVEEDCAHLLDKPGIDNNP